MFIIYTWNLVQEKKKGGKAFVSLDDFQCNYNILIKNSGHLPDNRPGR